MGSVLTLVAESAGFLALIVSFRVTIGIVQPTMKRMTVFLMLLLSALLMSCATTYDQSLQFRRVCWGDGVCHVEELQDGDVIRTYGPQCEK